MPPNPEPTDDLVQDILNQTHSYNAKIKVAKQSLSRAITQAKDCIQRFKRTSEGTNSRYKAAKEVEKATNKLNENWSDLQDLFEDLTNHLASRSTLEIANIIDEQISKTEVELDKYREKVKEFETANLEDITEAIDTNSPVKQRADTPNGTNEVTRAKKFVPCPDLKPKILDRETSPEEINKFILEFQYYIKNIFPHGHPSNEDFYMHLSLNVHPKWLQRMKDHGYTGDKLGLS